MKYYTWKYYTSTTKFNCGIDLYACRMQLHGMDCPSKKLVN